MNILKALSVSACYVLRIFREVVEKADVPGMIEHSFMLPIFVRYGVGCEWEFAEYSIFRVLSSMSACGDKSSLVRPGR
jgi:hypothetical protein